MVKCEVPGCTNERVMSWRPVGCDDRFRMVCRVHADRHHDEGDAFDLSEVFWLQRSRLAVDSRPGVGVTRFPDFGHEVKRPHPVHDSCYDCAAFYEGCEGWRAAKEFHCGHYQRLPDVMPGTCGQPWLEKVFVPADPNKGSKSVKQRPSPPEPKPKSGRARQCDCGETLAKGRRYCDRCRGRKRRKAMRQCMRRRRAG